MLDCFRQILEARWEIKAKKNWLNFSFRWRNGSRKLMEGGRVGWDCVFVNIQFLFEDMTDWLTMIQRIGLAKREHTVFMGIIYLGGVPGIPEKCSTGCSSARWCPDLSLHRANKYGRMVCCINWGWNNCSAQVFEFASLWRSPGRLLCPHILKDTHWLDWRFFLGGNVSEWCLSFGGQAQMRLQPPGWTPACPRDPTGGH